MSFLTLSDGVTPITIRVASNQMAQKYNEHGLDRVRTFDGSMRQIRRGVYREWNGVSAILSDSDALALCALLTSNSLPLSMIGDLCGDECAVMPILISNDPVHTATGFKRKVTFTLHETPSSLPPDTSATPFAFYRRGTGMFSDDAGTTPALTGDDIHVWKDQMENFDAFQDGGIFANTAACPERDGEAAKFYLDGGTAKSFSIADIGALTECEMLIGIRADADPSGSDGTSLLFAYGNGGASGTNYPKTTGHIIDSFGTNSTIDWGDPTDDLVEWNVFSPSVSATQGYVGRLNNVVRATLASGAFTFGLPIGNGAIGNGPGGYFTGWIRDIVIFNAFLTTAQRRSWYDYISGAVDDPPLA